MNSLLNNQLRFSGIYVDPLRGPELDDVSTRLPDDDSKNILDTLIKHSNHGRPLSVTLSTGPIKVNAPKSQLVIKPFQIYERYEKYDSDFPNTIPPIGGFVSTITHPERSGFKSFVTRLDDKVLSSASSNALSLQRLLDPENNLSPSQLKEKAFNDVYSPLYKGLINRSSSSPVGQLSKAAKTSGCNVKNVVDNSLSNPKVLSNILVLPIIPSTDCQLKGVQLIFPKPKQFTRAFSR
jgi:hypothetical protein